jgi:hypothetical protein
MTSLSPGNPGQEPSGDVPARQELRRLRRSIKRCGWVGGSALLATIPWAILNVSNGQVFGEKGGVRQAAPESVSRSAPSTLNEVGFASMIWRTPPKPRNDVSLPPPPPPPRLQLLAIDSPAGQPAVAIIYDQDLDTVSRLPSGSLYRGNVIRLLADRVVIGSPDVRGHSFTLFLDPIDGPAARRDPP